MKGIDTSFSMICCFYSSFYQFGMGLVKVCINIQEYS